MNWQLRKSVQGQIIGCLNKELKSVHKEVLVSHLLFQYLHGWHGGGTKCIQNCYLGPRFVNQYRVRLLDI
jgi:hypothetical protein